MKFQVGELEITLKFQGDFRLTDWRYRLTDWSYRYRLELQTGLTDLKIQTGLTDLKIQTYRLSRLIFFADFDL